MATIQDFNETAQRLESMARSLGIEAVSADFGTSDDGEGVVRRILTVDFGGGANPILLNAVANTPARTPERIGFLSDCIITAVEGGTGYWAEVRNYKWSEDTVHHRMLDATVELRSEIPRTDEPEPWFKVNLDTIDLGIQRLQSADFRVNPNLMGLILAANRDNDAGDIDADAADCIVQAALFGELVYG